MLLQLPSFCFVHDAVGNENTFKKMTVNDDCLQLVLHCEHTITQLRNIIEDHSYKQVLFSNQEMKLEDQQISRYKPLLINRTCNTQLDFIFKNILCACFLFHKTDYLFLHIPLTFKICVSRCLFILKVHTHLWQSFSLSVIFYKYISLLLLK